jgi:hypothetical protein
MRDQIPVTIMLPRSARQTPVTALPSNVEYDRIIIRLCYWATWADVNR